MNSQQTLLQFLQADLELCTTMLHTAEIASEPEHRNSSLGRVRAGIAAVRSFANRLTDREWKAAIAERANALEQKLELVEASRF